MMNFKDRLVVVVDDYEISIKTLIGALKEIQVQKIHEFDNAKSAIAFIKETLKKGEVVDLIFSDWNMPVQTGMDFLKIAKADQFMESIPFVMVTAESEAKSVMSAIRAGCADYLVKPINAQRVQAIAVKIFSKKK